MFVSLAPVYNNKKWGEIATVVILYQYLISRLILDTSWMLPYYRIRADSELKPIRISAPVRIEFDSVPSTIRNAYRRHTVSDLLCILWQYCSSAVLLSYCMGYWSITVSVLHILCIQQMDIRSNTWLNTVSVPYADGIEPTFVLSRLQLYCRDSRIFN